MHIIILNLHASLPIFKTVEQMSQISGLGESKLRELMNNGEMEFVPVGNRRLLTVQALWEWYERNKTACKEGAMICL
ncbi:DNA-binding protein [Ethanoligenens sp.]|uniref:DNA-binding protein n=1 Tax=Ethanoligenens sp. TaxID=2099655 RepID=UPI0039EA4B15